MKQLLNIGLTALLLFVVSCDKMENDNGSVDIYLIDSYSTVDNTLEIDESSVIVKSEPLIMYSELKSYNKSTYTFRISEIAVDSVKNFESLAVRSAFAIYANEELVYTGYFWPSTMSSTCDWVVIDPLMVDMDNKLEVKLGYPGLLDEVVIPDDRNDSRIIDIFRKDGKLKK